MRGNRLNLKDDVTRRALGPKREHTENRELGDWENNKNYPDARPQAAFRSNFSVVGDHPQRR